MRETGRAGPGAEATLPSGAGALPARAQAGPVAGFGAPLLLALFFITLIVPGTVTVAGMTVSLSRIYLLIVFVPLFLRWVGGQEGRIVASDIFVLLYCVWVWASLFVNHGLGRFHSGGIQFVEMFGGYLIGRILVRSSTDYRRFVRCMFLVMLFLLPFALVEFLTGWSPLRAMSEAFMTVEERKENHAARLGFAERVQGPFAHAILFGLFCSLGVANFFFSYGDALVKRLVRMGVALSLIFMSLSSAPLLAAALQIMMIGWDRIFSFFKTRWVFLVVIGVTTLAAFEIGYPGGFLVFFFEHFLLMPQTGYGRLEILYWGSRSVAENPIFGVGQNEWVRAYWMGHPTIDNFWLATAVRYGLPTLFFLWAAIASNMIMVLQATGLDAEEIRQRRGYLIALTGLVLMLATVSIWGPVSTFVLTYCGAGVWMYLRSEDGAEVSPRERRATRTQRMRASQQRPAGGGLAAATRGSEAAAGQAALRPSRSALPVRRPLREAPGRPRAGTPDPRSGPGRGRGA